LKILVTGSSGFVGSHLCDHLVRAGHQVRAFFHYSHHQSIGNLIHSSPEVMAEIQGYWGDIQELNDVLKASGDADVIYHLAALIDVPRSLESPHAYLMTNIIGTYNVLEAAKYTGAKVVLASSSEAYGGVPPGTGAKSTLNHTDMRHPRSPYAATKVAGDALAEAYFHSYDVTSFIIRPFNTYGPRQSVRALVPHVIVQLLQGDQVVIGNLSPRRSLVYIDDVCDAYLKCLDCKEKFLEVVVGQPESYSVQEIINMIGNIMGKEPKVMESEQRKRDASWEVPDLRADTGWAKTQLDWEPQTDIIDGLDKTIQWFKERWKLS